MNIIEMEFCVTFAPFMVFHQDELQNSHAKPSGMHYNYIIENGF